MRNVGAWVLIFLGVVFLLIKQNILPREFFREWWPLILIIVGTGMLWTRRLGYRGKKEAGNGESAKP